VELRHVAGRHVGLGEDRDFVLRMVDHQSARRGPRLGPWRGTAVACPPPQCGHVFQEERPDAVNAELLDLLPGWKG